MSYVMKRNACTRTHARRTWQRSTTDRHRRCGMRNGRMRWRAVVRNRTAGACMRPRRGIAAAPQRHDGRARRGAGPQRCAQNLRSAGAPGRVWASERGGRTQRARPPLEKLNFDSLPRVYKDTACGPSLLSIYGPPPQQVYFQKPGTYIITSIHRPRGRGLPLHSKSRAFRVDLGPSLCALKLHLGHAPCALNLDLET